MTPPNKATPGNRLLQKLRPTQLSVIMSTMELVELKGHDMIVHCDKPIDYAYFPESGVISIVTPMEDGTAVEAATIGNEGMVGVPLILGAPFSLTKAFCQVPGYAWRMPAADFKRHLASDKHFFSIMLLYTQTVFDLVAQTSACNRLHTIEQRCARWLLLLHDRSDENTFQITQEFLAQMLGVQRSGVNLAAGALQKRGMIKYVRGKMTVLDRDGLDGLSCECYRVVRKAFDKIDAINN